MSFKNGQRVSYTGDQKSLKGLQGVVERDTVAANGNILVRFDGRDRGTVVNPKNLIPVVMLGQIHAGTIVSNKLTVGPRNPKDMAVLLYGTTTQAERDAKKARCNAKDGLAQLGLVPVGELDAGTQTLYESNAVRLDAETSAAATQITVESLTEALKRYVDHSWRIESIVKEAQVAKKRATTLKVIIK